MPWSLPKAKKGSVLNSALFDTMIYGREIMQKMPILNPKKMLKTSALKRSL